MRGVSAPALAKFLKEQFPNDNIHLDTGEDSILVIFNRKSVYLIEWDHNKLARIRATDEIYNNVVNTLDIYLGCHPAEVGKPKRIYLYQKKYIIEVEV